MPYYFYFFDAPLWNTIFWISIYTVINMVMLLLIYLESRPIKLCEIEQNIYKLTFKLLEQRVFKKLIDQGSSEELQPGVIIVNRDSDLDRLMLVVEG